MLDDTAKFTNVEILFDDGSFAIAKGIWEKETETIGARWHANEGLGYPQTHGKPQWFIFPAYMLKPTEFIVSFFRLIKHVK